MRRWSLVIAMCLGLVLLGCGASTAPQPLLSLDDRTAPTMMRAPYTGEYMLVRVTPAAGGKGQPGQTVEYTQRLHRGEPLGFRQRNAGPVAVAGEVERPVDGGAYKWLMKADPGQTDVVRTIVLTVVIVAVAFGIYVILVYAAADAALGDFLNGPRHAHRH